MSLQQLREQRDAQAKIARELVNKKDWNAANDQAAYDAIMAEIGQLDQRIDNINKLNEIAAEASFNDHVAEAALRAERDKGDGATPALKLFATWLKGGDTALQAAERRMVFNTMSVGTGSQGGYTVQSEIAAKVIELLKQYGGMREIATVIRTEQGNPLNFPTSDGTTEIGEIVAENAKASAQDASFGTTPLSVVKYGSKSFAVPIELLQDSVIDIEAFVLNRIAMRLARKQNLDFTLGTGTGQPTGVITASSAGVTAATGGATTVTYANLVDLQHSVDPAYRALGRTRYMFHDQTLAAIRKITDSQNRPIFVPGYTSGLAGVSGSVPDTILGKPFQINQDMPIMAANAKSIAFGDFSYYTIRDAMDVTIQRYTDSAFGLQGQVGFIGWMRSGGNLIDAGGAVRYFQNSAT